MKRKIKALLIVLLCISVIVGGGVGYLAASGYKAQNTVFANNEAAVTTQGGVKISRLKSGNIEFAPENARAGLIFYPGGSVEYTAYAPLLEALADNGILCVLVKMPLNLAVLSPNSANGISDDYPGIKSWYIGGHSLGGAMAGTCFSKSSDAYDGLILLAAYSTEDISGTGKSIISIYGSNDGVLNKERYEEYRSKLPDNLHELVIDGGCHSYFGDYGNQKSDGSPTITRDEQIKETVDYICDVIFNK